MAQSTPECVVFPLREKGVTYTPLYRSSNCFYMKQLITYLSFNGNCRQAMEFYQYCLGGELHMQTVGESPLSTQLPAVMKDCILHAHLQHQQFQLMGTDMGNDDMLERGNAISILLDCSNEKELARFYQLLSQDGKPDFPIEKTFWNALIGGVTDKFGTKWLLHYVFDNQITKTFN